MNRSSDRRTVDGVSGPLGFFGIFDEADQTHGAFGAKIQIRPLLTQTSGQLQDLRYDSAPGILWPGSCDAADCRANGRGFSALGRPRRPYLGRSCRALVGGRVAGKGDGSDGYPWAQATSESNGCQRSALSSFSPPVKDTKMHVSGNAAYERSGEAPLKQAHWENVLPAL